MQVLVDTSVWSLAFRRTAAVTPATPVTPAAAGLRSTSAVAVLRDLVIDGRAALMGSIRQELLSGIKSNFQFVSLRQTLSAFDDIALTRDDYQLAAEFFNTCRSRGVQGSQTDFLICAVASARKLPILTTDLDFVRYGQHLNVDLLGF